MFRHTKKSFDTLSAIVIVILSVSFVNSLALPDSTNREEGRALDSIGGGHILRGTPPRGSLDSIGGGHILRALDSIGGGNILRGRQLDSIGGGHILRDADKNSFRINSKRNFDEIGHGNDWGRFVRKRNFDEIDGGRFDSRFVKKALDEIDG